MVIIGLSTCLLSGWLKNPAREGTAKLATYLRRDGPNRRRAKMQVHAFILDPQRPMDGIKPVKNWETEKGVGRGGKDSV